MHHGIYGTLFAGAFLAFFSTVSAVGLSSYHTDSVRKPLRTTRTKRGMYGDQERSGQQDLGLAAIEQLFGAQHHNDDDEGFMMITTSSGGGMESMFGEGLEQRIEMITVGFGDDADRGQATTTTTISIEPRRPLRRILPGLPGFPTTLRAQQITADTRGKAERLHFVASATADGRLDPFARLLEHLEAFQQADQTADRAETPTVSENTEHAAESEKAPSSPSSTPSMPKVKSKFPSSQSESFNTDPSIT